MKLESKHVLPYVLYGVQFITEGGTLFTVQPQHFPTNWNKEFGSKLALRPLSEFGEIDLRKIHEFIGLGNWCEMYDDFFTAFFEDVTKNRWHELMLKCPYEISQYFFVNKYDVFNLIPAGLAVDINTLNKPKDSPGGYGGC